MTRESERVKELCTLVFAICIYPASAQNDWATSIYDLLQERAAFTDRWCEHRYFSRLQDCIRTWVRYTFSALLLS